MPPGSTQKEVWLSDNGVLRTWAQRLLIGYKEMLGPVDISKVLFFRVVGNGDLKKKGYTYKLNPPNNQIVSGLHQLLPYVDGYTGSPEFFDKLLEKLEPGFVIVIYDDHHKSEADRLHTLLHELYHISPDMTKLRDHDVKDHGWMVMKFGLGGQDLSEFEEMLQETSHGGSQLVAVNE